MAGVAIVAGLAALEVISLGTATPLVAVGTVLVVGGMTAVLSGQVADVAADAGRKVLGPNEGSIKTGIPTISLGGHAAAYLGSYASCNRDTHGSATSTEVVKAAAEDVVGGLIKDGVPKNRYFPVPGNIKVIERHGRNDMGVVTTQIEDRISEYMVPFATLFAGDYLCFDAEESDPPKIVVWDHERSREGSPVTLPVADNFTAFLSLLYGDEEADAEGNRIMA